MQSSNEKHQPSRSEQSANEEPELSEAFRLLLGLQSEQGIAEIPTGELPAPVPPQASDPWSHLVQAQGMQAVDLQKVHLRDVRAALDDNEIEDALDIMRESTGYRRVVDSRTREA